MTMRVSGKHMEIGDAFRTKIEDQIASAVCKYFDGGYSSQVTVEKTKVGFDADCRVHLDTGIVLHAAGNAHDPQLAFESAAQRIEKRLRRYKRRLKDHRSDENLQNSEILHTVFNALSESAEEIEADFAPTIVAESTSQLQSMTVADAVLAFDMTDEQLFLFRNKSDKAVNIIYRRNDGNIGWIDTSRIKN